jgi:hypothetical protein
MKSGGFVCGYVSRHFDFASEFSVTAPVFICRRSVAPAYVRTRRIIMPSGLNENVRSIYANLLNQMLDGRASEIWSARSITRVSRSSISLRDFQARLALS